MTNKTHNMLKFVIALKFCTLEQTVKITYNGKAIQNSNFKKLLRDLFYLNLIINNVGISQFLADYISLKIIRTNLFFQM